jgi:RimJ/RimL family protein N-acetyltransferase
MREMQKETRERKRIYEKTRERRLRLSFSALRITLGPLSFSNQDWSKQIMKHKLLLEIPEVLETNNLIIRKYKKGDGKENYALFERNNNRELLKEFVDEATDNTSIEDSEIKIREHAAEWEARTRFVMGIWMKEEELYIGEIWIEPKKWEVPSFELGYYLDTGFQGRGLAFEASNRALKFLFEDLQAHKVIVLTRDTNEKSWKLAERLGFVREGHLRECGAKDGDRWGLYHYGMLVSEYETDKADKP